MAVPLDRILRLRGGSGTVKKTGACNTTHESKESEEAAGGGAGVETADLLTGESGACARVPVFGCR